MQRREGRVASSTTQERRRGVPGLQRAGCRMLLSTKVGYQSIETMVSADGTIFTDSSDRVATPPKDWNTRELEKRRSKFYLPRGHSLRQAFHALFEISNDAAILDREALLKAGPRRRIAGKPSHPPGTILVELSFEVRSTLPGGKLVQSDGGVVGSFSIRHNVEPGLVERANYRSSRRATGSSAQLIGRRKGADLLLERSVGQRTFSAILEALAR